MGKAIVIEDFIGKKFGRLTITSDGGLHKKRKHVLCKCDCGSSEDLFLVDISCLISGNTKSCGCRSLPIIGSQFTNNQGLVYEVVDYIKMKGYTSIMIRFLETGYERVTRAKEVLSGSVKDLYSKSICGKGYIGEGSFGSRGKDKTCYQTWHDMLMRCYDPKTEATSRNYYGVTVCGEWHNYQVFAEWYHENYIDGYHLDKDFTVLYNKVYSPSTCLFVPAEVNGFFTGGLITGVYFNKEKGLWVSQCQNGEFTKNGASKQTYLGSFKEEVDAKKVYKDFKKTKLDIIVSRYKDTLTEGVIRNMYLLLESI